MAARPPRLALAVIDQAKLAARRGQSADTCPYPPAHPHYGTWIGAFQSERGRISNRERIAIGAGDI